MANKKNLRVWVIMECKEALGNFFFDVASDFLGGCKVGVV